MEDLPPLLEDSKITSRLRSYVFKGNVKKFNVNIPFLSSILPPNLLDKFLAASALFILSVPITVYSLYYFAKYRTTPVFAQKRYGKEGKEFVCYKFRSTRSGVENDSSGREVHFGNEKIQDYITKEGKILRKYSLDELLNLYNVVKGDMVLCGHYRPLSVSGVNNSQGEKRRHDLRRVLGMYEDEYPCVFSKPTLLCKLLDISDDEIYQYEDAHFRCKDFDRRNIALYNLDCIVYGLYVVATGKNK